MHSVTSHLLSWSEAHNLLIQRMHLSKMTFVQSGNVPLLLLEAISIYSPYKFVLCYYVC